MPQVSPKANDFFLDAITSYPPFLKRPVQSEGDLIVILYFAAGCFLGFVLRINPSFHIDPDIGPNEHRRSYDKSCLIPVVDIFYAKVLIPEIRHHPWKNKILCFAKPDIFVLFGLVIASAYLSAGNRKILIIDPDIPPDPIIGIGVNAEMAPVGEAPEQHRIIPPVSRWGRADPACPGFSSFPGTRLKMAQNKKACGYYHVQHNGSISSLLLLKSKNEIFSIHQMILISIR